MSEHLRFSPDILSRLGEELVPDIDQSIIELVKNAYDADATECAISLNDLLSGAGSIVIRDNGVGMTGEDIRNGWLVIGRSSKSHKGVTPVFGRVPVGDKGLGRLSALRLGREVRLRTRPAETPGREYELRIEWEDFDRANLVEDVAIEVKSKKTSALPGTEISIDRISAKIGRATINKLARSLLLLSDPFDGSDQSVPGIPTCKSSPKAADPGFKAALLTDEYADLQAKVGHSYFSDAEYRIHAELYGNGTADFSIIDWKGELLHREAGSSRYGAPPFVFDLWVFILNGQAFSTRTSGLREVREWLKHVGGVHIYEDAIRVPPYGGPGDDWLELNLRRAKSPELRPSTNTSVGRVNISNADHVLVQKTDRVGYVENTAFLELRRCCGDALEWTARLRTRERDRRRTAERQAAKQKTQKASSALDAVLTETVHDTERKKVEDAIQRFVKESERETKSLKDDLQLYRSLATAGMTSAMFAHEIGRPLSLIDSGIEALRRLIPADQVETARRRIERVSTAAIRLNSFISIPLTLLLKKKRRWGRTNINACLVSLVNVLKPILEYFKIDLELSMTELYNDINGSEALVDGICLNLIMNAINAFQRENYPQSHRRLRIATDSDGSQVILTITDNGGGIDGVALEDIWSPGVTTSAEGTGFGLTIVRDSVLDLGGVIEAIALVDYGGAEFAIRLPIMRTLFE
jgi:signal transduction histidine kinase